MSFFFVVHQDWSFCAAGAEEEDEDFQSDPEDEVDEVVLPPGKKRDRAASFDLDELHRKDRDDANNNNGGGDGEDDDDGFAM